MSHAQKRAFEAATLAQQRREGKGGPFRDAFFKSRDAAGVVTYPLASLLSNRNGTGGGGRGGKTRLLLYVSLLWVAGGGDHTSHRPASFWAALLGLEDPDGAGSRVIRSSWKELEKRNLIASEPGDASGDLPTIRALREDRSGEKYTIPTGQPGDTYRRIPELAWRMLFHSSDLTGPGLVMYLISLRTHGQASGGEMTFPRNYIATEYGISDSTRKAGLRNLVEIGVLAHEGTSKETGATATRLRGRNVYTLGSMYAPPASPPGS